MNNSEFDIKISQKIPMRFVSSDTNASYGFFNHPNNADLKEHSIIVLKDTMAKVPDLVPMGVYEVSVVFQARGGFRVSEIGKKIG